MRKSRAKIPILPPDPKFNNVLITRFVNNLMLNGKKTIAFNIFFDALEIVEKRSKEKGVDVWKKALDNVTPNVEVKSRRIGGATFQIPQEVRPRRKISLGMKWIISHARHRTGKSMKEKLAQEILAASKGEGGAYKKKEDTRKMAEANKAFSHFRF
ncbi:MAG: 30S ribosomal protein S7 [Bacteroidota bacterium]